MGVKFFIRFNLHNSICRDPLTPRHLRAHLELSDDLLLEQIRLIEDIQKERTERVKSSLSTDISRLLGKRVLFAGDSVTSDNLGYRGTVTRAASLDANDLSVSGGVSSMIIHDVIGAVKNSRPDILSLMIGSNDSVSISNDGFCQVSLYEYSRNVEKMVECAVENGVRVILFEIPPICEPRFEKNFSSQGKTQSNINIARYNAELKKTADRFGIELVPNGWLSDNENNYEPDGIHLSLSAQEQFAARWLAAAARLV